MSVAIHTLATWSTLYARRNNPRRSCASTTRTMSLARLWFYCALVCLCASSWGAVPRLFAPRLVSRALASLLFVVTPLSSALGAEWTERNRLAAETWRAVDEVYVDRTFNGKDWFQLRQDVVKRSYKSDDEVYAALKSMLANLGDKYTRYLPPVQYATLMNSAVGELTGVGLELLGQEDGGVRVVNIADGSPAVGSGISPGDVLINVDGTATSGLGPEEVAALIRGKPDTKASVTVRRGGSSSAGKDLDFVVVRKAFKLKGVSWGTTQSRGKTVGFLTIKSFSGTTRDDVLNGLASFHVSRDDDVDAIVMDMRNNGGGLLQGAVETANLLLPPGKVVVFTVGKDGLQEAQQTLPSGIPSNDPNLPDLKTPLYILVNKNSASAAEVLAAALKENGRAKLVGENTFGKGIIQNVQELRQGGIAVTVAKYETPLHHDINKVGIPVDISMACDDAETTLQCIDRIPL